MTERTKIGQLSRAEVKAIKQDIREQVKDWWICRFYKISPALCVDIKDRTRPTTKKKKAPINGVFIFECRDCLSECRITKKTEGIPAFCPFRAYSDTKKNYSKWIKVPGPEDGEKGEI